MAPPQGVFLSAEWRDLVMLNYEVEPALLESYVPPGTVLDRFEGRTFITLVGFRFRSTKLLGRFKVPFHSDFDEVNLRFYVRRREGGEDRRGVVFIAEIVPRYAIAATARMMYGERYVSLPMQHSAESSAEHRTLAYRWRMGRDWCRISAQTSGEAAHTAVGSLEEFIAEHYWGYSTQKDGGCVEYHVSHPPWRVWATAQAQFEGNVGALYGPELATALRQRHACAFVADGSDVVVFKGQKIS